MDVDGDRLLRERLELLPGPAARLADRAGDRELPLVERDVRRGAGGQHGEAVGQVLARRKRDAGGRLGVAAPEASGDRGHVRESPARGTRYASLACDRAGEQLARPLALDHPGQPAGAEAVDRAVSRSAAARASTVPGDRAVLDAGGDRGEPRGRSRWRRLAQLIAQLGLEHGRRQHLTPDDRGVARLGVELGQQRRLDRGAPAAAAGRSRGGALVRVVERRAHEPVAGAEVVVEERDGHARLLGDLLDAKAADAAAGDDADGRIEDRRSAVAASRLGMPAEYLVLD